MHNRTKLRKARKVLIEKLKKDMDPSTAMGMIKILDAAGELKSLPSEYPPGIYSAAFDNGLEIVYANKVRCIDKSIRWGGGSRHDNNNPYLALVLQFRNKLPHDPDTIAAFCENSDLANYAKYMEESGADQDGNLTCSWSMVKPSTKTYGPIIPFSELRGRLLTMAITTPWFNIKITKSNALKPKPKANFSKPDISWTASRFQEKNKDIIVID